MKRISVFILSLVYFTSVTGATVHLHYCMGSLANWGLTGNRSQTCGKCGMEMDQENDNGCCKDELRFFKNDVDQKTTHTHLDFLQRSSVSLPEYSVVPAILRIGTENEVAPQSNAPPRCGGAAVYIRNCLFLI